MRRSPIYQGFMLGAGLSCVARLIPNTNVGAMVASVTIVFFTGLGIHEARSRKLDGEQP